MKSSTLTLRLKADEVETVTLLRQTLGVCTSSQALITAAEMVPKLLDQRRDLIAELEAKTADFQASFRHLKNILESIQKATHYVEGYGE